MAGVKVDLQEDLLIEGILEDLLATSIMVGDLQDTVAIITKATVTSRVMAIKTTNKRPTGEGILPGLKGGDAPLEAGGITEAPDLLEDIPPGDSLQVIGDKIFRT